MPGVRCRGAAADEKSKGVPEGKNKTIAFFARFRIEDVSQIETERTEGKEIAQPRARAMTEVGEAHFAGPQEDVAGVIEDAASRAIYTKESAVPG